MTTTRRALIAAAPAFLVPMPSLATLDDPLFDLCRRWHRQARIINDTAFAAGQDEVDPALMADWYAIEDAMIGVRPTTRDGALAANRIVTDDVIMSEDARYLAWLALASREFLEANA